MASKVILGIGSGGLRHVPGIGLTPSIRRGVQKLAQTASAQHSWLVSGPRKLFLATSHVSSVGLGHPWYQFGYPPSDVRELAQMASIRHSQLTSSLGRFGVNTGGLGDNSDTLGCSWCELR